MEKLDAIVVGGGIAGLTTSLILGENGYSALLIEKERRLGGTNNSFNNDRGDFFDFGYHTLDYNRSPFTTRFFARMLKGNYHTFELKRGIAIRGHAIPYNASISEWPAKIAEQIGKSRFVDDLEGPPTREALAHIYGNYFADIAFDEILESYPALAWQKRRGKPEYELMDQVYPWFFPKSERKFVPELEWSKFHQKMRDQDEHLVMYPDAGGFGSFVDGIVDRIDGSKVRIVQGVSNLDVDVERDTQRISGIQVDGVRYSADRYFWCAPLSILGKLLGAPFPSAHPQMLCLGSYAFEGDLPLRFHEILVGELNVPINRISFPGAISGRRNNLMQVEYSYPLGEADIQEASWAQACLEYMHEMQLVQRDNRVLEYKNYGAAKGFVSTRDPRGMLREFRNILNPSSNIVYPYIGLEVDSVSRIVPSVFRSVYQAITG